MNNAPQFPLTDEQLQNLKNNLEIEYNSTVNTDEKRAIHFEIECYNDIIKARKTLKETESLLTD